MEADPVGADPVGTPRLRIAMLAPESTGGIGRHVREMAAAMVGRGHEVVVLAPAGTLDRFAVAVTGAAVVTSPVGLGMARALRRLSPAPDIVHAHGVRAGAFAALARVRPLVTTWHNAPLGGPARRGLHAGLERLGARRSDLILGASADLVDRAICAGARRARPFAVVAPARPVTETATPVAPEPAGLRELAGGHPVVLCVARLHHQKRIDLLIDALAGRDDVRAFVVGDGPLRARLHAQALERRSPVAFLGGREDVPTLLGDADVLVLPSDWEARPLAVQEAMDAGVPVVATDVGGVRGLVGEAAVLVPPGDAPALASALERLLGDDAERATFADRGRLQALKWPTLTATIDDLEQLYLDLTSRSRP